MSYFWNFISIYILFHILFISVLWKLKTINYNKSNYKKVYYNNNLWTGYLLHVSQAKKAHQLSSYISLNSQGRVLPIWSDPFILVDTASPSVFICWLHPYKSAVC